MAVVLLVAYSFGALALAATLYILFFAVAGQFKRRPANLGEAKTRFLILVPAHDEEAGILNTLVSIRALDYPQDLLQAIVVADNCTDQTAQVVRDHGFEAWVRVNDARGKGQALRWALNEAEAKGLAYDAMVVIDADGVMEPRMLRHFDAAFSAGAQAVQARNIFEQGDGEWFSLLTYSSMVAESDLFWAPRSRLGLTSFILGHGFAVRREVLERIPWNAFSIVEDVQYCLELQLQDVDITFVPGAQVLSRPTQSAGAALPQRLRYAAGTLQLMLHYAPRLLAQGVFRLQLRKIDTFLALMLTSRMLILYLTTLAFVAAVVASPLSLGPLALVATALLLQFIYLVLVLRCGTDSTSVWRGILFSPFYLGWLLWVQLLAALGRGRKQWARTSR